MRKEESSVLEAVELVGSVQTVLHAVAPHLLGHTLLLVLAQKVLRSLRPSNTVTATVSRFFVQA